VDAINEEDAKKILHTLVNKEQVRDLIITQVTTENPTFDIGGNEDDLETPPTVN
jgi:hypothetical protein